MEAAQIEQFVAEGFVKLSRAVPRVVIDECVALLWEATGLDPQDPTGWSQPIVWVGGMPQPAFVQAMNVLPVLEACERLAGPGRWQPRNHMGSFPLRFPHDVEPDGLGWHVEGSYTPEGERGFWTNYRSRDRALLALYLLTDIDDADGPTLIRVGSHRHVPAVLVPYGEEGAPGASFAAALDRATAHCPVVTATGEAGDVFVCHPFVVHAAQANHGTRPRFVGQPAIPALRPYRFDLPDADSSPVELTIKRGLAAGS